MGAWTTYGLGSACEDLPGFVVLQSGPRGPRGGAVNWGSGFLPTVHQGVPLRGQGEPILNLTTPDGITDKAQKSVIDAVKSMNLKRLIETGDPEISTRISAYEMAYKMQSSDPDLIDLSNESQETMDMYGVESNGSNIGRNCLLARRLVEKGVRFIEVNDGGWDTHDDNFGRLADKTVPLDQALSALIGDLDERGLLDDTLIVLATEFGRTPTIQTERNNGRNHYPQAFSCLLAGGGVKGGYVHGKTDEEGREVIEDLVTVPDFNATIGHAMGLPLDKKVMSPEMRPFTVGDKGQPVLKVFS